MFQKLEIKNNINPVYRSVTANCKMATAVIENFHCGRILRFHDISDVKYPRKMFELII